MTEKAKTIFSGVSLLVSIVALIISMGLWIGRLQAKVETTADLFKEHQEDQKKLVSDIHLFMVEIKSDISSIKTEIKRNK